MLLTVSKRLEFSASRRLFSNELSLAANRRQFGQETEARYGTGRNYTVWFVFSGRIDKPTGMLMNISEIKARAGKLVDSRYDHKFLNEDNADFAEITPTVENVARQLLSDARPLFRDSGAELWAVHLVESPQRSATAYAAGEVDSNYVFDFSAARQTTSPHLSAEENARLFGVAASPFGHGHNYRVRLTLPGKGEPVSQKDIDRCTFELRTELDHRNLNAEVTGMRGQPITTETLAAYIFTRASTMLPIDRVRLHEREDFFAEYLKSGEYLLGMQVAFSAAHRLQSYEFSEQQNAEMYGKCNNPGGHGHSYVAEATIDGPFDVASGSLFNFDEFRGILDEALRDWNNRHLDLETEEFRATPSTGENIVTALWGRLRASLHSRLRRLRLWETANNRFTLRSCKQ